MVYPRQRGVTRSRARCWRIADLRSFDPSPATARGRPCEHGWEGALRRELLRWLWEGWIVGVLWTAHAWRTWRGTAMSETRRRRHHWSGCPEEQGASSCPRLARPEARRRWSVPCYMSVAAHQGQPPWSSNGPTQIFPPYSRRIRLVAIGEHARVVKRTNRRTSDHGGCPWWAATDI